MFCCNYFEVPLCVIYNFPPLHRYSSSLVIVICLEIVKKIPDFFTYFYYKFVDSFLEVIM